MEKASQFSALPNKRIRAADARWRGNYNILITFAARFARSRSTASMKLDRWNFAPIIRRYLYSIDIAMKHYLCVGFCFSRVSWNVDQMPRQDGFQYATRRSEISCFFSLAHIVAKFVSTIMCFCQNHHFDVSDRSICGKYLFLTCSVFWLFSV